jgi:glycine betaine/proline transport system ATP-binding protein
MSMIRIEKVSKVFGPDPGKALELLDQGLGKEEIQRRTGNTVGVNRVSFEVKEGEIVVVMGLSGSGKSTLVRCLNRLIEPTEGRIWVDDEELTALSPRQLRLLRSRRLGMVFQNFALLPHRTIVQNVEYGLEVLKVDSGKRRESALRVLDQVGLKGWEESYPAQLSGGMQQRVGLARALALDPDILLMDEAFSALDPLIRADMQDELVALQEKVHKTIVFISHDLDEALKLGDRIVLMKDGAVVQIGTPEEILTHPADEYVARFVADVDVTKVLTAGAIMKKSETVAYIGTDGPRSALRKMRSHAISSLFVVDRHLRVLGAVSAEDVAEMIHTDERDLSTVLDRDVRTVALDTPAMELFAPLKDSRFPLAVVDEEGRLKGVIVRGQLIATVAERRARE